MTRRLNHTKSRWAALVAPLVLASVAAGWIGEAAVRTEGPARIVVVVDASAGRDDALVARAEAAIRRAERTGAVEAELRVPRTPTEQLSVTRYFAARGFDLVIGTGLDRRIAVEPVARRYPEMGFRLVDGSGLPAALATVAAPR